MAITELQRALIDQVEQSQLIDQRYKNLKCVNMQDDERQGVLSIVFKGYDVIEDKEVIIKFFDPQRLGDTYRLQAFKREPDVIRKVSSSPRCLTLVSGLTAFNFSLPTSNGAVPIPQEFFVVDNIPYDVDEYFFDSNKELDQFAKLSLYKQILLGVFALHQHGVYHRDIKVDNLRRVGKEINDYVIAIDFGTAAHLETPNLVEAYVESVGAPGYASPESRIGLAGIRRLGKFSDIYTLGILLFELFNIDYFYKLNEANQNYRACLAVLSAMMANAKTEDEKIAAWNQGIRKFKAGLDAPSLLQAGHSVPSAAEDILVRLYKCMTAFDFHARETDTNAILMQVNHALKVLQNVELQKKRKQLKDLMRLRKIQKAEYQQKKLEEYLKKRRMDERGMLNAPR